MEGCEVTDAERLRWIDTASYHDLLVKWRQEPPSSPWFVGETGRHYGDVMRKRRSSMKWADLSEIENSIPWERDE